MSYVVKVGKIYELFINFKVFAVQEFILNSASVRARIPLENSFLITEMFSRVL